MKEPQRLSRREALRWMAAATATISILDAPALGATKQVKGYGSDPNLMEVYKPGDFWPLTLTAGQRATTTALCDTILPADDRSPSASQLKIPDFIDEWISAPCPVQQADRKVILKGLGWLDRESRKRFGKTFAGISDAQRVQICDEICFLPKARAGFKEAARFFSRFRSLAVGAFYSTPEGTRDIQYVGNVPLAKFDGPPPEVLAFLKLGS
ncbi:MAG: gluconate 2-dehydrogenase subunit 3 family protein [Limisphaerales bacterium]